MDQTLTIPSFEEACKIKGLDAEKVLPDVSAYPQAHGKALIATAKLFIIADAVNEGWQPDWSDYYQRKYWPWFNLEKSKENPSGFCLYYVDYGCADSNVSSRLCFRSREIAEGVATKYIDLYRDLMVL